MVFNGVSPYRIRGGAANHRATLPGVVRAVNPSGPKF